MGADPQSQRDLCDAIAAAITIADRDDNHLAGALLMQAFEAAGCSHERARDGAGRG